MPSNSSGICVHHYKVEILNLFDPELRLINTNPVIRNKLKDLKVFKVQATLVLDYNKRNGRKTFHSSAKLIGSDSDIDETFKLMHQSIMTQVYTNNIVFTLKIRLFCIKVLIIPIFYPIFFISIRYFFLPFVFSYT